MRRSAPVSSVCWRPTDHRIVVAEIEGKAGGVLHVFERPAFEKPCEAVVQALVVDSEAAQQPVSARR